MQTSRNIRTIPALDGSSDYVVFRRGPAGVAIQAEAREDEQETLTVGPFDLDELRTVLDHLAATPEEPLGAYQRHETPDTARNADGRLYCAAERDEFACSRETGHTGPHVAAGRDLQNSICEVWDQAERREKPTADDFGEAAREEARRYHWELREDGDLYYPPLDFGQHMAEWARTHLAAQRAGAVRAWAALQYPSGTPLDQDRRMVAAETEAYLSGRTGRETSELSQAAKHAGPIDPPAAQEPTDAEVEAAAIALYNDDESWGFVVEFAYGTQAVEWDDLGDGPQEMFREFARRALRAARRDEEKR